MSPRRAVASAGRLIRDVTMLAFARRSDGRRRSIPASVGDLRTYLLMRRALRAGRNRRALARAESLLQAHPDLATALRVTSEIGMRRGGLTAPLAATRTLRSMADSAVLATRERQLVGRLQETEPGWLPRIDGPATRLEPRAPNVVMHLLKASLPERQSGYTIRSRETLRAQRAAGLEPFVVTPFGYPPARDGIIVPAVEFVDDVPHYRLGPGAAIESIKSDELLSRTAALAATIAGRERPAIIQAASGHRGYENALVGLALRRHLARPLVYEVRGFLEAAWTSDPVLAESAEWSRRRFATELRVMADADAITTLSGAMRDELVARGVSLDKIVVVPNGIDPAAFAPTIADADLRRRYGLEGRWVFGYVSNMDHVREGQAALIEATARLVRAGRQVSCLLVGDGSRRATLEAQAAASGVGRAIVFTGRVPYDAVRAHYALLDAFVVARLPDRASRFVTPLKPYEAMAMGLPLVVSDVPALLEIAAPDERGLAFPAGDVGALVAALERLIDQPDIGRRMGSAGRAWVLTERTWAADGERYRELVRSVLERFDPATAVANAPS